MASPKTSDGTFYNNEEIPFTLRALAAMTTAGPTADAAVTGFGPVYELLVMLNVTIVSFVGGTAPTATLEVWLQRTLDGGTTWEDVLAFKTAALSAGGTATHSADVTTKAVQPGAPAAIQDAGGTTPFAQRLWILTDQLRVKSKITTAGAPTSFSVTFSVTARGRR